MIDFWQATIAESLRAFWAVVKITVPMLLLMRALQWWQVDLLIAQALEPSMQLLGLPGYAGIIWAAAIIGNLYTGLAVGLYYFQQQPLSIAEMSTLCLMMLIAHNLIVESVVAAKVGAQLMFVVLWRLFNAYLIGWLSYQLLQWTNTLQQPAEAILKLSVADDSWTAWLISQINNLAIILFAITLLVSLINLLRIMGIEQRLHRCMRPFLKAFYLSNSTANITIIGITLGISYGAGLLINDIENGQVERLDGAKVMSILNLNHAIIEDTLLMILIGASAWFVLVLRLILGLLISWLYNYSISHSSHCRQWTTTKT